MKKRLFLALPLPETIKKEVESYKRHIESPTLPPMRWVPASNYHVTISFFGDVEVEKLPRLLRAIDETTSHTKHFSLLFDTITFAPPKRPRMLWLRMRESDKFHQFVQTIASTVGDIIQVEAERKKTIPHITLARLKDIYKDPPVISVQPRQTSMLFKTCELFESNLTSHGPEYTSLQEFHFE